MGLPELASGERYDSVRKRAQHHHELVPMLREVLSKKSALEWEVIFSDEVPCAAALEVEDMFEHPQVLAEELIATFKHSVVGSYRGFKNPIRFGRTPCPEPFAAPTLGQHNDMLSKK